ncbi:hypothetical protein [Halorientalis litorea]|nr:hypothetical protein [Halorientalis litorea]
MRTTISTRSIKTLIGVYIVEQKRVPMYNGVPTPVAIRQVGPT